MPPEGRAALVESRPGRSPWPALLTVGVLGVLALIGGLVQIPGVSEVITHFLEPTFEDSIYAGMHPSVSQAWTGLAEGALISIAGIATAWLLYIKRPDLPARFRSRFSAVYTLCVNKWYGDQVIDFLIVNPVKAFGRFCNGVFERGVINGATAGVAGITRSAGAAVRDMQSGLLRGYAVLMLFGILAIVVYFLIRSI